MQSGLPLPQHGDHAPAVPPGPDVSIIVLVTQDPSRLLTCLASIRSASDPAISTEVIVLANGTHPGRLGQLEAAPDVTLLRSAINHGFGGGCNLAARHARGRFLLFLNDDTVVRPRWLRALLDTLTTDAAVAVGGSRVLRSDGRLQESGSVVWRDGSISHLGRGEDPASDTDGDTRDVDYVSFCSAMVRRTAWDQVGGFDERYFPAYYEDADICFALRAQGWRVVCVTSSVVVHEESASTGFPFRHFLAQRNRALFAEKWASELQRHEARPTREARPHAVRRTLERLSGQAGRGAAPPGTSMGSTHPGAVAPQVIDEVERLRLEVRHLRAHVAVLEEYVAQVQPASADGEIRVAAQRLRGAVRRAVADRLRAYPRLRRVVHRVTGVDTAER